MELQRWEVESRSDDRNIRPDVEGNEDSECLKRKESIKVARGRVKGSLTRLENGADDLNSKNEILIRLQRLEKLIVDFERLDSELRAEESEIMEFEQRYFDLKLKF
ncbi:hypothetical protein TNCV_1747251 [Trichonephila clavipes]|nr:hypothetical protein TNCV_1747251 [Trichonephila clavipes]